MVLKIAVLKNFLKTSTNPFIVREEKPKLGVQNPLAVQGVFFADEAGVEVRSSFLSLILPGSVLTSVPETLAACTYALAVRAAVNGKDVTVGRFEGMTAFLVAGSVSSAPPEILSFL